MEKGSRHGDARERMIDGAAELFRERGIAGTSMADIVEHSRAPRGSLYHYFPAGKDQLAAEATATAGELLGDTLVSVLTAKGPERAFRIMIGYFRQRLVETNFTSGCPVAAGALEGDNSPGAREAAANAFTRWEAAISATLREEGVAASKADGLATLAVSTIEGSLILSKAQRNTRALDRAEKQLADLLRDAKNHGQTR